MTQSEKALLMGVAEALVGHSGFPPSVRRLLARLIAEADEPSTERMRRTVEAVTEQS